MKSKINKISCIEVNDIFDELIDENKRLKQCLNVLIKFKNFVDLISNKLKTNLDSNDSQKFEELHIKVEEVLNQTKTDHNLIEIESKIKEENEENDSKLKEVSKIRSKCLTLRENLKSKPKNGEKKKPIPTIDGKYVCDFIGCGALLKSKKSLYNHRLRHQNKNKRNKRYVCDFNGCDYSTDRNDRFVGHMNVHKGVKPYICEICYKSYHSNKNLKQHKDWNHITTEETFVCEINDCKKQFNNKQKYLIHKSGYHLTVPRFVCTVENCQFKAKSNCALNSHMASIHLNERPFHCDVKGCNKTFKLKSTLNHHILSHTTERNFICEFADCKKTFKTFQSLREHTLQYHTQVKERKCFWPGCEYTTISRQCLTSHQRQHSIERNYPCNWPQCHKRFKTSASLKDHLRIHRGDKKYVCPWPGCTYRCTNSGNIGKHRKLVHKM